MPRYRYRCPVDGAFDLHFTMGSAPDSASCESCCATSSRVYSLGAMLTADRVGARVLDLHEQSRSAPAVVRRSSGMPDPAARRYADPRHRLLPRP